MLKNNKKSILSNQGKNTLNNVNIITRQEDGYIKLCGKEFSEWNSIYSGKKMCIEERKHYKYIKMFESGKITFEQLDKLLLTLKV